MTTVAASEDFSRPGGLAPTRIGRFLAIRYEERISSRFPLGLVLGKPKKAESVPVHIHRSCPIGDRRLSINCRGAALLEKAFREIEQEGVAQLPIPDIEPDRRLQCCTAGGAVPRAVDEAVGKRSGDLGLGDKRPAVGDPNAIGV
ncbi:MAG: hypothetical protein U0R26_10425 [Solirubrobacterales bacterium]